jgi:hypothetical protein
MHPEFPKGEPKFARLELSRTAGFDSNAVCDLTNLVVGNGAFTGFSAAKTRDGRHDIAGAASSWIPDGHGERDVALDIRTYDAARAPQMPAAGRILLLEARPSGGGTPLPLPPAPFDNFGQLTIRVPRGVTHLDLRVVYEPVRTIDIPLPPSNAKP